MDSPTFIHTHIHTEYSLVDGLSKVPDLVQALVHHKMPAAAVTEKNNMFSVIKFYETAKENGIKPIIGCNLSVKANENSEVNGDVIFLCMDHTGYLNLNKLVTKIYDDNRKGREICVIYDWIEQYNEGLIALSGGVAGDIGKLLLNGEQKALDEALMFWKRVFSDRYYLEVYNTNRVDEKKYFAEAIKLADEYQLPVVATNDVIMSQRDDFRAHEAKFCIQSKENLNDKKRKSLYSEEQYLKSQDEMVSLFSDFPELLKNSVEIAKRCNLSLEYGENLLPHFINQTAEDAKVQIRNKIEYGLAELQKMKLNIDIATYRERADYELGVISKMNYEGYFLIVADFIDWARQQDIPVGPGRGSGAGSVIAYLLKITDIDPLEYDLLFERFLNVERISMPDFDIDFCIKGRDKVIDYVIKRYGQDKSSHINTFSTFGARGAIRDIGRVLNLPYLKVDEIAKAIPEQLNITIDTALKKSEDFKRFYESEDEVRELIDLSLKIEGLARNSGRHAGGIVISPEPLTNYTALYREEDEKNRVSQFDMKDIEKVGLIKFDFLGLKTLTIINQTQETLKTDGHNIDLRNIDLKDAKTYQLLQGGQTTGIFQLESDGIRELVRNLHPDHFNDLVALLALYRPGPLEAEMEQKYVKCKKGAEIKYIDPSLEPILKNTYGVILYQEQVMQIAQELAGYTLGAADILRRAMGKKNKDEMAQQRKTFIEGAVKNQLNQRKSNEIFDLMEHFAGYGFNKSHSVAYATIVYQTAWLKANHPEHFMAAVLTEENDIEKVGFLIDECRTMSIDVLPPDINQSLLPFTVTEHGIIYGLENIRSVGSDAMARVINERDTNGPFASLLDFCSRMATQVKRTDIEALVSVGSFDQFGERAEMLSLLPNAVSMAEQDFKNRTMGQSGLFGDGLSVNLDAPPLAEHTESLDYQEMLNKEFHLLGRFITGHPIDAYQSEITNITKYSLKQLISNPPQPVTNGNGKEVSLWVVGVMMNLRNKTIKGKRSAFFTLDDNSSQLDVALFGEDYQMCEDALSKKRKDIVAVEVYRTQWDFKKEPHRWRARQILSFDDARMHFAENLFITLSTGDKKQLIHALKDLFQSHLSSEGCPVVIAITNESATTRIAVGEQWYVKPHPELIKNIQSLACVKSVELSYRNMT